MKSPSLRSLAQACPSSGGQCLAWHPLCTPLLWSDFPQHAFPSSSQWRLLPRGCSLPTDAWFLPFGYWFSKVNKRRVIKHKGFLGGSDGKESACNVEDLGSIPALGRFPGEGNGNPIQHSDLENSMDRGAWQATVNGVTKSQT